MTTNIDDLRDRIQRAGLSDHIDVRETESADGELFGYEMSDDGGVHSVESWAELSALVEQSIQSYQDLD